MKLVTFSHDGRTRIGAVVGDAVVDLAAAAPDLPTEMVGVLEAGSQALGDAHAALNTGPRIPLADVHLDAPIARPPKFLAIGLNYADHVAESGMKTPQHPTVFNKQSTSIIGPGGAIHVPRASDKLDYEGEFAVVIGRRCRHVPRDRAQEVIAGYTVANDVSVRDWQLRVPTMTMGKSFDTHCPLGPTIVTPDEISDPHALGLRTFVNDEERQNSNTKELIFDSFDLVEHL